MGGNRESGRNYSERNGLEEILEGSFLEGEMIEGERVREAMTEYPDLHSHLSMNEIPSMQVGMYRGHNLEGETLEGKMVSV